MEKFEFYDLEQLERAKTMLDQVYNYYYDAPFVKKEMKRLLTIIAKLDTLIDLIKGVKIC